MKQNNQSTITTTVAGLIAISILLLSFNSDFLSYSFLPNIVRNILNSLTIMCLFVNIMFRVIAKDYWMWTLQYIFQALALYAIVLHTTDTGESFVAVLLFAASVIALIASVTQAKRFEKAKRHHYPELGMYE